MSAIYSAPGGANLSERLQWFGLNRCKGSFQTETIQPCNSSRRFLVSRCGVSDPDGGAGAIRCNPYPRDPVQKEPDRIGNPSLSPALAPARTGAWFSHTRARKLQVPKRHTLFSHFSLFKHFKLSFHDQCGTKCF